MLMKLLIFNGDSTVIGTCSAPTFSGIGASSTNVPYTLVLSGTVPFNW
jgi:hypothetical protein